MKSIRTLLIVSAVALSSCGQNDDKGQAERDRFISDLMSKMSV